MVGKARIFSDAAKESVYQKEFDDELYNTAAQQNSYNLGSVHFSDQSGIGNFTQAGTDQRKANLDGALYTGNIGFNLQTAVLDIATNTIDLLEDGSSNALSTVSTDRIVSLSSGTTADLITILGAQRPGQRLTLYNILGNTITIKHTAAATDNTILTPDTNDFTFENNMAINLVFDITTAKWRLVVGAGTGGTTGTGTFVSVGLSIDQTTNLTVGSHVEFDKNTPPSGADGGIVLQTGVGQANGIFELLSGKTYFMTAGINPSFSAANDVEFVWFDITNTTELGRRTKIDSATLAMNQPKNEIIFTPITDVTVEVRIVAVATPANLADLDFFYTFASIFEFSGASGTPGTPGSPTWKLPARAKSTADVSDLANADVIFDGVTLVEDDRVLLTDQTILSENGLYQVGVVAAGFAPLTRPTDFDSDDEVLAETFVAIEEGAQFANELYHLITNNPITIDVSDQVWDQFAPGTSGGPDMGGGEDGIDGDGEFVNDGRVGLGTSILKIWEKIEFPAGVDPNNRRNNLIYMPSQDSPSLPGRLLENALSNNTRGGAFSDDYGETWSLSTSLTSNNGYGRMAYAPNLGTNGTLTIIRVQTGFGSSQFKIQVSTDRGTSFSTTTMPNNGQDFVDQIFIESLGLFVATSAGITTNAAQAVYTSPDGSTWTARTTPLPTNVFADWHRIVFSPSLGKIYIKNNATGANDPEFITSVDGITWLGPFVNDMPVSIPKRIIWSEGQQKFAAAGSSQGVFFSDDFITWTDTTPSDLDIASDIVWAPDLSLWVVIGSNTTSSFINPMIWASNDGVNWTTFPKNNFRTVPTSISNERVQIVYSEEFQYFFGMNSGFGTTQQQFYRTGQRR